MNASGEAPAPVRNPFPFPHKPNTLDRDHIVVPAGWDSWGKIGVLREGFDAKAWGEAWERDLESTEAEPADGPGARKMYRSLVPDQGIKVSLHPVDWLLQTNRRVTSPRHYHLSITQHPSKSS